jgi:hypothetical protein
MRAAEEARAVEGRAEVCGGKARWTGVGGCVMNNDDVQLSAGNIETGSWPLEGSGFERSSRVFIMATCCSASLMIFIAATESPDSIASRAIAFLSSATAPVTL